MSRTRSRSRSWALQVMYSWEMRGEPTPLRAYLSQFASERRISRAALDYLVELIDIVSAHRAELDQALEGALHNWRMERLSAIDRNILRLGAAELLFAPDVPPLVAIQESILLAEKFGTEQSPRFVNGVLDALRRQHSTGEAG